MDFTLIVTLIEWSEGDMNRNSKQMFENISKREFLRTVGKWQIVNDDAKFADKKKPDSLDSNMHVWIQTRD